MNCRLSNLEQRRNSSETVAHSDGISFFNYIHSGDMYRSRGRQARPVGTSTGNVSRLEAALSERASFPVVAVAD